MKYLKAGEVMKLLNISPATLMNWKNRGKIKCKVLSLKKVLYDIDSLDIQNVNKLNVIYSIDENVSIIKNYMISNGISIDKIYNNFDGLIFDIFKYKIQSLYIINKSVLSTDFDKILKIFNYFDVDILVLDKS